MPLHNAQHAGPFYVREGSPGFYHVTLELARKPVQFIAQDLRYTYARKWVIWLNRAHQAGYDTGLADAGLVRKIGRKVKKT